MGKRLPEPGHMVGWVGMGPPDCLIGRSKASMCPGARRERGEISVSRQREALDENLEAKVYF